MTTSTSADSLHRNCGTSPETTRKADGSPASAAAAKHGLKLAAKLNATVHAISVVNETSLGPDVRSVLPSDERERPAKEAVEGVDTEAGEYEIPAVQTYVEHGSPAAVIREHIETSGVHAVVMGSKGRRGVDRILLGSVAEKTVRSAPVPVITVHEQL